MSKIASLAEALHQVRRRAEPLLLRVAKRGDVEFIWSCLLLLTLFTLTRPMFATSVAEEVFGAPVVMWELVNKDVQGLLRAAQRQRPYVPRFVFVLVPTALVLLARIDVRWSRWEASNALRALVMAHVAVLTWAASTYDYNMYFNQGHWVDRAALVALAAACWWRPLAAGPFTALSVVSLWEVSTIGLGHDDFDWRPLVEVMMLFSCFVWLSFVKRLNTRHFIFLSLCLVGSYYYAAGKAKIFYGPTWSWLFDNHTSNLAMAAWQRGWFGFLEESTAVAVTQFLRHLDFTSGLYTIFIAEAGAILWINLHPRLTRWWLLCAAVLHAGIFLFAGVCFWKWIAMDLAFWHFLRYGGAQVHKEVFRHKLVPVFGLVLIFFSVERTYFNPTTGVSWYDTNHNELYHVMAVGLSGKRYEVDPNFLAPYDARMTQENFCFLTDEPHLTAIYGQTGNHKVLTKLADARTAQAVENVFQEHKRDCRSEAKAAAWDKLISSSFSNTNLFGRKHRWLSWIGRPDHIWLLRPSPKYQLQEPVKRIEVWREVTLFDGESVLRLDNKMIHEVEVPLAR